MEPRPLSSEELEVLTLYANGYSTDEIGERLSVHKSIVQDRLRIAARKLSAVNRAHAVALAVDQRIIKVAGGRARRVPENVDQSRSPPDLERRIRERAYQIWLEEGRPHGFDKEHWLLAKAELEAEAIPPPSALPENKLFSDS